MAKLYGLTAESIRKLQEVLRWYSQHRNMRLEQRRRRPLIGGSGGSGTFGIKMATPVTASGEGATFMALLSGGSAPGDHDEFESYNIGESVWWDNTKWKSLVDGNIGHTPQEDEWWELEEEAVTVYCSITATLSGATETDLENCLPLLQINGALVPVIYDATIQYYRCMWPFIPAGECS